jgi:hypothetical protein
VGRLCTRGKYLGIKENAHELFWGISAFLSEEFKSLKKGSMDLFPTGIVKEKSRGEGEFKAFRAGNCLFNSNSTISSNSSLRMF